MPSPAPSPEIPGGRVAIGFITNFFVIVAASLVLSLPCFAGTSNWNHNSEADFKAGTMRNVVATNLGDLKLSRAVKTLLEQDARISAVTCLTEAQDGTIYAGTSPQGVILSVRNDEVLTFATLEGETSIFSLVAEQRGALLVATGGDRGRVLRVDASGRKVAEVFSADEVQYVWSIAQASDGTIFVATGPNGQLFEISPRGDTRLLLDSNEHNLLSLSYDGGDFVYVGTDPNGLLYRVNRKTGETFILYDAAESEISALARDAQGNIYAGTAQATGSLEVDSTGLAEQTGRPEAGTGGVPIPSQPPANPQPPAPPDPNPGEPPPIPSDPKSLVVLPMQEAPEEHEPVPGPRELENGDDRSIPTEQPVGLRPEQSGEPGPEGNAIYKVDTAGFVTEIFRQPVLVLSLLESGGTLIVGTGSEGLIYQVNPAAEETLVLSKVDPKQVMSLLRSKDGRIFTGLANAGGLAAMSAGFATEGTFVSPVLDATQTSQFGKMRLRGTLPDATTLSIATRSGNVQDAGETGWSPWSQEMPAAAFIQIPSPNARFLQYRITFDSDQGVQTPVVEEVNLAYRVPNLAPRVTNVQITVPEEADPAGGTGVRNITWEAADPNEDQLQHAVYFRSSSSAPWILIKDKLTEATHAWDTRTVADGRYEVRVVSSDASSNLRNEGKTGSRVSDPIIVDNAAPTIGDLQTRVNGNEATIELKLVDRTGSIASVEYAVDSADDWQAVTSSDNIFDGPEETVAFTVPALGPGRHQITIRAADDQGNRAFESVRVTIGGAP